MAGAIPVNMSNAGTYCANCFVFDWKQLDIDLLKICSGCREVWGGPVPVQGGEGGVHLQWM